MSAIDPLRRLAARTEGWFFDDVPVEPLAACRIALGLSLFYFYAQMAPSHALMFGPEGLVRYAFDSAEPHWLQRHAGWLLGGALVGSAGLALGLLTRLSGLIFVAAHIGHTAQTTHFTWGWSLVAPVLVLYLVASGSHRRWSLDAHLWGSTARRVTAWPLRLLQLNTAAIYIAAAWHRIDDGAWLRGEMVFEAVACDLYTRAPGLDVHLVPYSGVLEALCWYTWIVELAAPLLLWPRRTRVPITLALFSVHIGLELGAAVGIWQFMMMSLLLCFLPPRWLDRIFGWPGRLVARRREAPPDGLTAG